MMSRSPRASRQRAQPLDIFLSEGYGRLPGLFLAGYRPFEAITIRARLNNRGPVSNPIQERLAQPGIGKDLCPFREWQIGSNDQGRSLGSFADDLKHQLRADLSEGDIAHLINGDQIVACPSLQSASELVMVLRFNQLVDQSGGSNKADSLLLPAGSQTEPCR